MKFLIRRTAAAIGGLLMVSPVFGDPVPQWVNSYSVDDSCYCAPKIDASLSKKISPTPVGGKSIGQICERIGQGPGLIFENDEFNYPVYTDAQCGNGPAVQSDAANEDCEGRLTDDDIICMGTGPVWDLKTAFARKPKVAPEKLKIETADTAPVAEVEREPTQLESGAKVKPIATVANTVSADKPEDTATSSTDGLPVATVVAERVVPEITESVSAESDTSAATSTDSATESLPLATIVDTQPISAAVAAPDSTRETDARAPLLQPDSSEVEAKPAVQTIIVRAPDTDSGAILVESEPVVENTVPKPVPVKPITTVEVLPSADTKNIEITQSQPPEPAAVVEAAPVPAAPISESPVTNAKRTEDEPTSAEVVTKNTNVDTQTPGVTSGLRVDSPLQNSGVLYKYVQLAPVGFDFGGSGGAIEASIGKREGWGLIGRAAVVEDYSEFMVGAAYSSTPVALKGATISLTLGGESGNFDLGITDYSDTGVMASAMLGYDFNTRLQAQGGVSYSTFFDGDPSLVGLMLMHLTPTLDIAARVEVGDNDNASVGLRFNY